jgi:hypothetical protein
VNTGSLRLANDLILNFRVDCPDSVSPFVAMARNVFTKRSIEQGCNIQCVVWPGFHAPAPLRSRL